MMSLRRPLFKSRLFYSKTINKFLTRFLFKPKYPHEIWFNRFLPWSSLGRVEIDQTFAISYAKLYSEDPKIPLHSDESNEKLVELLEKRWIKVKIS